MLNNPTTTDFPTEVRPAPRNVVGQLRATDRKGDVLTIRVSREEYDRITAAADLAKLSVNQWCRAVLVKKASVQ